MIRQYRTLFFLGLLIPALGVGLVNLLYLAVLKHDAARGRWIEEPMAKSYLLSAASDPDYIFIGSSRTQNHIDSQLLGRMGISALNLGMAGREWEYYAYVVRRTATVPGGTLVISIPADVLFGPVSCPETYYYQWQLDRIGGNDIGCFFIGNVKWDSLLNELPMNRFRVALEQVPTAGELDKTLHMLATDYGYRAESDGRRVNYVRGDRDRSVLLFANGDGQVFSYRVKNSYGTDRKTVDRSRSDFDPEAAAYLGKLARLAQQSGKHVIYIIEPTKVGVTERVDLAALRAVLPANARVISNADRDYARDLWADKNHFNLKGSARYTTLVYAELRTLNRTTAR